ncbi:hypothetical protein PAXRUDRAFT_8602 [Paxillus rubicundulus Ve08.2h10]|uniref:Uncharacterized protein n=1 Tax=Paxillus rubicundulus Ve08.2h10 TaxID=930991 RepID=A0A0D0ECR6_9AGAM|nr:hypothetical protein PAXRUDRAFT_8602 [Paxillus rubicundulus Ve08.2h10]
MRSSDSSLCTEFNHSFEPLADHHPKTSSSKEEWSRAYHTHTEYFGTRGSVRHLSDSPCSSSATLLNEDRDDLSSDAFKLIQSPEDSQASDAGANPANCTPWPPSSEVSEVLPKQHLHALTPAKSSFNPKAAPFIPSPKTILGFMQMSMQTSPVPARPFWVDWFWHGSPTDDLGEQEATAKGMMLITTWSFDNIRALAQMFCWECARPTTSGPFARAVYEALKTHCGEWESSCFRFYLRKYAIESFRIAWSFVNSQAISQYNPPTPEHLQYTYHISTFVVELFAAELILRTPMIQCLGTILNEMCSIEHVYALQKMVISAKEMLWQGPDSQKFTEQFVANFAQRTSSLPDRASFGPPASIAVIVSVRICPCLARFFKNLSSTNRRLTLFGKSTNGTADVQHARSLFMSQFGLQCFTT